MARTPQVTAFDLTPVVSITVEETNELTPQVGMGVSGVWPGLFAYHHQQGASSAVWTIEHGLGFYPNVTTMDSGGSVIEGELQHVSKNHLRVTFSAPISGNAYLS